MNHCPLDIAFFGSSLVSSYWNGAATYYRGIIRALALRGHRVTFYEPDAFERQQHRDMPDPEWARVVVYQATDEHEVRSLIRSTAGVDIVVKASGVGVFDAVLEEEAAGLGGGRTRSVFWDVDAPATLERLHHNPGDPFHKLIPRYDFVLTYGGGEPVRNAYLALGARRCEPIYNALDPETHQPTPARPEFDADLAFLGNRLPDRESRVEEFFLATAEAMPEAKFLIGGSGWGDKVMPANVHHIGHVGSADHNAFNCSPKAVLNISRDSMARFGFSPATRVFEAAGAAACIITDEWEGIDQFLEPQQEVLVARDHHDVVRHLRSLTREAAKAVGDAARARILREHTYEQRVVLLESLLASDHSPS